MRRRKRVEEAQQLRDCSDSSGRWWRYDETTPARDVAPLLAAIEEDVTGIFWG